MATAVLLKPDLEPYPGVRLRQLLGRGGFAEVWEAAAPGGRRAALKFLKCENQASLAAELKALQAIRTLQHPHLIHIERVWCYLNYIVIDMELGEGSLLDLLDAYQTEYRTPILAEQVCVYLSQVAEALDFLNTRQHMIEGKRVAIQHCDIKPSNLLLFGETVKVTDFGLSSLTTATMKFHRQQGTLDYTAPEVFQGRLSDRTDQYALAVSYCHLRGGRLPFPDTPEMFSRTYVRPEPDLMMLPFGERSVVARALARAPQNRWPSCGALMSELTKQLT